MVLFDGGDGPWWDANLVLDAFPAVLEQVPNAKLYFLGLQPAETERDVRNRANQLGLAHTAVFFGDVAGAEDREPYLLEADVAVGASRDVAEARLAPRSQLLDYLWAGLPVVATEGDALAEVVRAERLGLVAPPRDTSAVTSALVTLLTDPVLRSDCSARSRTVAERYRWRRAVEPLGAVLARPWRWRGHRRSPPGPLTTEEMRMLVDFRTAELRNQVSELEAKVRHQERVLALLRRSPVYPVFLAAKRTRQWARRFSG